MLWLYPGRHKTACYQVPEANTNDARSIRDDSWRWIQSVGPVAAAHDRSWPGAAVARVASKFRLQSENLIADLRLCSAVV